ncbi:MAG: GDP-L-fucose synthase [Verrucomicrobia bacterium]|nr:GDP-L-fucose synthase [Verrucomicrobiota bacterium]
MRFKSVFIAGHRGLVGSAVVRRLQAEHGIRILTVSRRELDLRDREKVLEFLRKNRPEAVVMAAAKVGGIQANSRYPVDFLLENLEIQNNLFAGSFAAQVKKVLFLGSSCIYPKLATQPMREESLLTGALEPTNEPYAIAKIAGVKLGQAYARQYGANYISAMPTNLYGPGDNFDLQNSHVLPALLRKAHEAKLSGADHLVVWGSGEPRREFLHSDDLGDALYFLLENYDLPDIINVGFGSDVTIRELAVLVQTVVGFRGELVFDRTKPDGTPRKLMDSSRLHGLGWRPRIDLEAGIRQTYEWYQQQCGQLEPVSN